ncbi:MAG: M56 family metallopeptidase, partial [Planctomycetota bacterium]
MALLEHLLSQQMIERLGWTLVHFVWQATVIALLLAVALRCLRRRGAEARYVVSCLALMLIIALPLATALLVEVSGLVAEAGPAQAPPPMAGMPPFEIIEMAELPVEPLDAQPLTTATPPVGPPWTQRAAAALEPALPYLVVGWLLGVFGLAAWHLGGWAQLQRVKRRLVREVGAPLTAQVAALSERLGIDRAVVLLESALVEVPTVVGWIKPVILLPTSVLTGLDLEQLRAILAHELAHIRRHDYLVNIAQTVVEILGFYHPAVWWVSHRIRDERENCCDDVAVQVCGDSVRYARALTRLEEMRHRRTELAVAASGGSLVARIGRLLGRPTPDNRRFTWLPGLIALLLVALIVIPTALAFAAPGVPPAADSIGSKPSGPGAAGSRYPGQMDDRSAVGVVAQAMDAAEQQDEEKVVIDVILAKALANARLDRETILLISDVLVAESPEMAGEISRELKRNVTLGEILQRYVAKRPLGATTVETLVNLLQSRGYLEIHARPSVLTRDNIEAQIMVGSEVPILPPGSPASAVKYAHLGTAVKATPHFPSSAGDRIRLEVEVKWTEWAGQVQAGFNPAVRTTEIASTVTTLRDRYFSLLLEPGDTRNQQATDSEFMLVMFRANSTETTPEQGDQSVARAPRGDRRPRQVLLEVRTIAAERSDLAELDLEWSFPRISAGTFDGNVVSGWPRGLQIGYTPDKTFTGSLLLRLGVLRKQGRVELVASQRVLAYDGSEARVRAITEEWFLLRDPKAANRAEQMTELTSIATGTVLSATPRIGDNNEITLALSIEYSQGIPSQQAGALPVVTRRKTSNVVTVADGGTVALAGLADSGREILILVTANIVPENGRLSQTTRATLSPPPTTPVPSDVPAVGATPEDEEGRVPPIRVRTETPGREASSSDEETRIMIDLDLVNLSDNRPLPPETAARLASLWNGMYEKRKVERAVRAEELQIPPVQLLERCTENGQGDSDALEIMIDLLASLEYLKIVLNPTVDVYHGKQAQIKSSQHVPYSRAEPGVSEMVECGTVLKVTPYAENAGRIALDVAVDITDLMPSDSNDPTPRISTCSIETRAVLDKDKTLVLRLEPTTGTTTQEEDVLYLLVRPRVVPPEPAAAGTITAPPPKEEKQAFRVEARFLHVSDELLEGLAVDTNTPEALAAILAAGEDEPPAGAKTLDDTQVRFLFKAAQGSKKSRMLALPRMVVVDGETAEMRIGRAVPRFVGFLEPNEPSQE